MKQRIRGSRIPPCHGHTVIAPTRPVHCLASLPRCSADLTSAECCLEVTARGTGRLSSPSETASSARPLSLWLAGPFRTTNQSL